MAQQRGQSVTSGSSPRERPWGACCLGPRGRAKQRCRCPAHLPVVDQGLPGSIELGLEGESGGG